MVAGRVAVCSVAVVALAAVAGANGEPTWQLDPPLSKGQAQPAPRRKEEARFAVELALIPIDRIYVEGRAESEKKELPMTKEQRFAAALNAGNPEVASGKIRHGMFYDMGVYWAPEP